MICTCLRNATTHEASCSPRAWHFWLRYRWRSMLPDHPDHVLYFHCEHGRRHFHHLVRALRGTVHAEGDAFGEARTS